MCSQLAWVLSAVSALSDAQKSRSLVLVISGLVHARRRTSHGSCFLASLTRVAAGWQHYLPRPRCCLMRNLAQLPALATFSRLDVCCEVFFFTLLPFGIFGMTSARFFFQANSETRHGKSEWFVHVKSLWSLLEQLERFCDLDQKPVRWQGKIFAFWPLQNTPPKDDQITNLWKNK